MGVVGRGKSLIEPLAGGGTQVGQSFLLAASVESCAASEWLGGMGRPTGPSARA